ncbi:uncharacterized protein LOC112170898 [Rosa chinensis]|uniref:uncharacterized protein LOC112170898 n=1 Tax=Rosa chinensis TaxID=74649 RepID=UPI000D0926F9|nr:uncharacterized protein LOC112170898 [Rosa chinensis]
MNLLCWNCQGIGNPWTVKGLKGLVSLIHPTILFLSETKRTAAEMVSIRKKIGWPHVFSVDCQFVHKKNGKGVSSSGGVSLLWTDDVNISLKSYSKCHIDVNVKDDKGQVVWRFTGVYGQAKAENRHLTWSLLRRLGQMGDVLWVLGGDLNEITSISEKEGGARRSQSQMDGFHDALQSCDLVDMHYVGPKFTWLGIQNGEEFKLRLDRFVSTRSWTRLFPLSRVTNLPPTTSDHLPILLEIRKRHTRRKRRIFEDFWLRDKECKQVVEAGWFSGTGTCPLSTVSNRINNTRELLLSWSHTKFGSLKKEIEMTRSKLVVFYDSSFSASPDTTNRKKKNLIKGLYNDDGVWCNEDHELQDIVTSYFNGLFTSTTPTFTDSEFNFINPVITYEINAQLTKEISGEEVRKALKQMHPLKASGPDGFSPSFYQQFWGVVGRLISDNSLLAFEISHFLKRRRRGHVGYGALKLDMSKAYDRVEWPFLERVMEHLGFCSTWTDWQECLVLKDIFQQFEKLSGQQINYLKSDVSFSRNVPRDKQDCLAAILGVSRVDKHDKYLGLPIEISYSKEEAFGFLQEKVRKKTQGWKDKLLSTAGKEVLLKAVVQSIPTYVMSFFELPKHLCGEMHRLMARFWWGDTDSERKIH